MRLSVRPALSSAIVPLLALLTACAMGDAGPVDAAHRTDVAGDQTVTDVAHADVPATDVPTHCHVDSDCVGNAAGGACDTVTGLCVQCVAAHDTCPADQHCVAASNTCTAGCHTDEGCTTAAGDGGTADAGVSSGRCDVANNRCVQCLTDPDCPIGTTCVGNVCAAGCGPGRGCPMGQACCGSACVDVQANVADCGSCGNACHAFDGVPGCAAGACTVVSCNPGFGDCDHNPLNGCEVDTTSSLPNCGACGAVCADGANGFASCAMGACSQVCNFGFGDCDGNPANGCETSTQSSAANCGACGHACPAPANATASCAGGACGVGACNAGFADCDGNPANGCEVNTQSDVGNCGTCGHGCPAVGAGMPACLAGACGVGACSAGYGNCDGNPANGCEASFATDAANCGSCGHACSAGQACVGSACVTTTYTGYAVSRPAVAFVDACAIAGHASYLASTDDGTAAATLPFTFRFYATTTTSFWFSSNGAAGFATAVTTWINAAIPSASAPLAAIFPYWDDQVSSATGECSATTGAAPNRTFVVTWENSALYADSTAHITYSLMLHESTNVIDVVYNTATGTNVHGESATIGVQNETGTVATQFSFNTASIPTLPTTVRFTPM